MVLSKYKKTPKKKKKSNWIQRLLHVFFLFSYKDE